MAFRTSYSEKNRNEKIHKFCIKMVPPGCRLIVLFSNVPLVFFIFRWFSGSSVQLDCVKFYGKMFANLFGKCWDKFRAFREKVFDF